MRTRGQTPEDLGWTADDLRSARAADGSGPYRYAPDGSGPFSYDEDGSGPWLVGPDPGRETGRSAPTQRRPRGRSRTRSAIAAGTLALVLTVGSVAVVANVDQEHPSMQASVVHPSAVHPSVVHPEEPDIT